MPHLIQSGPLTFASGSSIIQIEGSNFGSIGFHVSLSRTVSLPEGQLHAVCIAIFLASGLSEISTFSQVPPAR